MSIRRTAIGLICGLGVALLLVSPLKVLAQIETTVRITNPDFSQFPSISLYVSVTDGTGRRIPGLTTSNFNILEDEATPAIQSVEEVLVGTRQIYAINTSPGMKVRDSQGRSRFDFVRNALLEAWRSPLASQTEVDDLTLLTADGTLIQHADSIALLASNLASSEPTFQEQNSGLQLVLEALTYAIDPGPVEGMPNTLVFVTPLIPAMEEIALTNTLARAQETGTTIYVVFLGSEEVLETSEIQPMQELASATGGDWIVFDPDIGLSALTDRILELRTQYLLKYESMAFHSSNRLVQVQVAGDGFEGSSSSKAYRVNLLPPEVVLVQLPKEVVRESDDPSVPLGLLQPTQVPIEALITFPDGIDRELQLSQFIVDGSVIAEREIPPFNTFEWNLTDYVETEEHALSIKVVDRFGFETRSIPQTLTVGVQPPPRGLAALRPAFGSIAAVVAVLILGVTLVVALLSQNRQRSGRKVLKSELLPRLNPIKRPTLMSQAGKETEAFLVPLQPPGDPIPLVGVDVILGRDASLSAIVLDDPSVEGMHTRLIRQARGTYLLRDQGSVAGTWVNFQRTLHDGHLLRHGDRIHIGRVEMRFELPETSADYPVRISSARPIIPPVDPTTESG